MRSQICLLAFFLLFASGCSKADKFQYKNYNLVLICLDALQSRHVHALGYPRESTPTLDAFARKSMNFTNAISASSWTIPSVMTWFTGMYPSEHRVLNKFSLYEPPRQEVANLKKLNPGVMTLAQILKKSGYATAGFTGDAGVSGVFGFNQGFDSYLDDVKFGGMDHSIPKALEWIQKHRGKKFFVFLHGYDVHGQHVPSAGFDFRYVDKAYDHKYKGTAREQEDLREKGLKNEPMGLRQEDIDFWRAIYDEKINRLDAELKIFLNGLEKLGLMKNTIIIVASDHGTEFYEHKKFDHGFSLYDELIHVLLMIKLPGVTQGRDIKDQVSSVDILPTALDLLGIQPTVGMKSQLRGVSLTPAFGGAVISRDVYSETDYRRYTYKRSVRTADGWKFIYTMETGERELYNLNADPREAHNKIEEEPRIAYELEQLLFRHLNAIGQKPEGPWVTGCYPVYDSQVNECQ